MIGSSDSKDKHLPESWHPDFPLGGLCAANYWDSRDGKIQGVICCLHQGSMCCSLQRHLQHCITLPSGSNCQAHDQCQGRGWCLVEFGQQLSGGLEGMELLCRGPSCLAPTPASGPKYCRAILRFPCTPHPARPSPIAGIVVCSKTVSTPIWPFIKKKKKAGLPRWLSGKKPAYQRKRQGLIPGQGRSYMWWSN